MTDETGFILAVTLLRATGFMMEMCTMSQRNLKSPSDALFARTGINGKSIKRIKVAGYDKKGVAVGMYIPVILQAVSALVRSLT